jgi:hypothetical protein
VTLHLALHTRILRRNCRPHQEQHSPQPSLLIQHTAPLCESRLFILLSFSRSNTLSHRVLTDATLCNVVSSVRHLCYPVHTEFRTDTLYHKVWSVLSCSTLIVSILAIPRDLPQQQHS